MTMLEGIKLAISVIFAMMEAMPQEITDATGAKMKIPDANYNTMISDGVVAMASGAGFSVDGLTDTQLRGAIAGFCSLARAYQKAPRVVVP